MTVEEIKAYQDFMWNAENAYNCKECPENVGHDGSRFPCGQQNCWVVCHVRREKRRVSDVLR